MISVFPDPELVAQAAADEFVRVVSTAIQARGRAVVALSGGSTPKRLHALLTDPARRDLIDWSAVTILWGDERFVPASDPQSNERMARETLLDLVPIPADQIHPMVQSDDPVKDAQSYEALLKDANLEIDLLLVGMGADGHTLSLFPGEPGVHEATRLVIAARAPVNAPVRITMTPVAANAAREVLFLITGADKAEAVQRCFEGPINLDETPSQALARFAPNLVAYLDKAAAANLAISQ